MTTPCLAAFAPIAGTLESGHLGHLVEIGGTRSGRSARAGAGMTGLAQDLRIGKISAAAPVDVMNLQSVRPCAS